MGHESTMHSRAFRSTSAQSRKTLSIAVFLLAQMVAVWIAHADGATATAHYSSVEGTHALPLRRSLLAQTTLEDCLKQANLTAGDTYLKKGTGAVYEAARIRTDNSAFLYRTPALIILPKTEAQVQSTVICLNKFNMPFVVRSGGHSYMGMSLLDSCGAVIDTFNMRAITVDTAKNVATAQAGVRLGALYYKLWLNGKKMFPAGTCPSVGLSGLMTGGGKGLTTRKLSFAVDQIISARVVLPNGTVRTASATSNPDLFFAIKGGSGSYGIITKWTLKVHQAPPVYTQLEMGWPWSIEMANKVSNLLFAAQPWTWPNEVSVVRLYLQKGAANPVRAVIHYWGTKAQMEAFMQTSPFFTSVPAYKTIIFAEGEYIAAVLRAAAFGVPNKNVTLDQFQNPYVKKGNGVKTYLSYYARQSVDPTGVSIMVDFVQNHCGAITMTFLGGAMTKLSGAAVDDHRQQIMVVQFLSGCADQKTHIAWVADKFVKYTDGGQQYLGYIGPIPNGADPWKVFFGGQADKLKSIREKYDPMHRMNALVLPNACNT